MTDGDVTDGDNVLRRHTQPQPGEASDPRIGSSAVVSSLSRSIAESKPVEKRPPSDFSLVARPAQLRVAAGGEGTFTVKMRARGPQAIHARLQVTGMPNGVTATLANSVLTRRDDDTTLTARVAANTPAGRYPLLITATAPLDGVSSTRFASVTLIVTRDSGAPDPQLSCNGADISGLRNIIYVAPGGSESASCGAAAVSACATIQKGIDNCRGSACAVLVRYGRYKTTATIALKNGVSVYGGCHFPGEPAIDPAVANYRSIIDAVPPRASPRSAPSPSMYRPTFPGCSS